MKGEGRSIDQYLSVPRFGWGGGGGDSNVYYVRDMVFCKAATLFSCALQVFLKVKGSVTLTKLCDHSKTKLRKTWKGISHITTTQLDTIFKTLTLGSLSGSDWPPPPP